MEQQEQSGTYTYENPDAQATRAPQHQAEPVVINPEATEQVRRKAQTSMILGIIGCVCMLYPVLSIAAIVLGALALNYRSESNRIALAAGIKDNGMGTAGFVTGLISTIGGALVTLLYLIALIVFIGIVRVAITELGVPAITSFFDYMESML